MRACLSQPSDNGYGQALFESLPKAGIVPEGGSLSGANGSCYRLFGLRNVPEELLGKSHAFFRGLLDPARSEFFDVRFHGVGTQR